MAKRSGQSGSAIIVYMLLIAIVFPMILTSYIDLTNLNGINKRLKLSLNAAAKSAASAVDWTVLPLGEFRIDPDAAEEAFVEIMNRNLDIAPEWKDRYYEYVNPDTGRSVRYFMTVYNGEPLQTPGMFPDPGVIPPEIYDGQRPFQIQVEADRPVVLGVAVYEYPLFPLVSRYTRVRVTQYSVAQLNDRYKLR